ncbi:MAG: alpha/beta hydrolase [bacterium]
MAISAGELFVLYMKRIKRTIVIMIITTILIGFISLNLLAYNHAYHMMHFTDGGRRTQQHKLHRIIQKIKVLICGIKNPRPVTKLRPLEVNPSLQEHNILCTNGIILATWYIPGDSPDKLVLLFHGYGQEKSSLIEEADIFHDLGFSCLLVDFRGSGDSSESYTSIGYLEADDVAEAVFYAKEKFPYQTIILFGQSMGAVAILKAINDKKVEADGVILEGVFDTLLNTVNNRFKIMGIPSFPSAQLLVFWGSKQMGFNGFMHNPVEYAQNVYVPALVMHGINDPKVLLEEAENVFFQLQGPKQFKKFHEIGHESYLEYFPDEWRLSVKNFINIL